MNPSTDRVPPTDKEQDREPLIKEVMDLFGKIAERMQTEDDEEKQWLIKHASNPAARKVLQNMTVMMLHVIDAIGRLEPVNGITISKQLGIPKGSVSKITRKLAALDLLRTESLPNNKKEVLFCLTPLGQELFDLHIAMHQQIEKGVKRFLQRYEMNELQFFARVLQDSVETSWLTLDDETNS